MKLWGAVLVTMLATQVSALSCMRPNVAETFNRLQKSDTVYSIAVGTVRVTSKIPKYVAGKPRKAQANFYARPLGLNGLLSFRSIPVTVQTHCVASWCGGIPQDQATEYLVFMRKVDGKNYIDVDACPEGVISISNDKTVKVLQKCLRRGTCSKADIKRLEQH